MALFRSRLTIGCLALMTAGYPPFLCAAETAEVVIEKVQFVPQRLKIKVGSTVRWINKERRTSHSIWFAKESLPESERFFPGESWERTFNKPGVYPYTCGPHPEMRGVIEVVP